MKKRIALVIAVLTALSGFAGCSGSNAGTTSHSSAGTSQVASAQENTSGESSDVSETTDDEPSDSSGKASSGDASKTESKPDASKASSAVSSKPSDTSKTESKSESKTESKPEQSKTSEPSAEASKTVSQVSQQSEPQPSQTSKPAEPSQTSQTSKPAEKSEPTQTSVEPQPSQPQPSQPETSTPDTPAQETDIGGMELYNRIFDLENNVTVEITMDKSEIDKLQADYQKYTARDDNKKSEVYRKATVTFTVNSTSYTVDEVGIRLKGNQSLEPFYDKKGNPNICSFKLSFDETFDDKDDYGADVKKWPDEAARKARKKRTFATLNEMDIKWNICYDETNIREIYATKLFDSVGVLVQKIGLSQMKINGNNYGLVKIYEPVDNNFLEKRLPESALGGDLYKCMWSECSNGVRTGRWRGTTYKSDNSYGIQENQKGIKYNFNLKTNKKTSKHESLKNLLNVVNKSNLTASELEKVLDTDYYAAYMAAAYFAGDPDDIRNNYNNHYVYFRKDTGKAIFIVYDNDRTMGITIGLNKNCAVLDPFSDSAVTQHSQENPIIKKTLTHNVSSDFRYIRDKYVSYLEKLSKTEMLTSDADFNRMYNTAKNQYESIVKPYTRFANQEGEFRFSLDGSKNGGDKQNMSFEQFRSRIMETYRNAKA